MQPMKDCATCEFGAAASHSFIAPDSSASRWPKVIQRSLSNATTEATAGDTRGNKARRPVWNNNGSSASTRNWLNVNPVGPMSGTWVEKR
jgi:hypothetical protein